MRFVEGANRTAPALTHVVYPPDEASPALPLPEFTPSLRARWQSSPWTLPVDSIDRVSFTFVCDGRWPTRRAFNSRTWFNQEGDVIATSIGRPTSFSPPPGTTPSSFRGSQVGAPRRVHSHRRGAGIRGDR